MKVGERVSKGACGMWEMAGLRWLVFVDWWIRLVDFGVGVSVSSATWQRRDLANFFCVCYTKALRAGFIDAATSGFAYDSLAGPISQALGIPSIHPSLCFGSPALNLVTLMVVLTPMAVPRTQPAFPVVPTLPLTVSIPLL